MEVPLDAKAWPDGRKIKFARHLDLHVDPLGAPFEAPFGRLQHPRSKTYEVQRNSKSERLVVGLPGPGIQLMRHLARQMGGPYKILYVLLVSCTRSKEGRYELLGGIDREGLEEWLDWFQEALDNDGRHNLWVKCAGSGQIIYDRHEVLFLYGDLDALESELRQMGYSEGEVRCDFKHQHRYWPDYDEVEQYITGSDQFRHYPLVPDVDF